MEIGVKLQAKFGYSVWGLGEMLPLKNYWIIYIYIYNSSALYHDYFLGSCCASRCSTPCAHSVTSMLYVGTCEFDCQKFLRSKNCIVPLIAHVHYIYDVYTIPISAEDLLLYKLMDSRAPLISKKHNRGLVQGTIQKSKSIATYGFWGVPNHV